MFCMIITFKNITLKFHRIISGKHVGEFRLKFLRFKIIIDVKDSWLIHFIHYTHLKIAFATSIFKFMVQTTQDGWVPRLMSHLVIHGWMGMT